MKRLLVLASLAGAAVFAAPAHAAPLCGPIAGVNCFNGSYYCRIWIAPRTCIHTS